MSLEPARINFTFWKGASFQKRLTYYQSDSASTPVDLTGSTAELIIKDAAGLPLMTLTSGGGGIVLGGTTGTIDILISAAVTGAVTWRSAVYSLSLTAATGNKDFLLYGNFAVKGS